MNIPASRKNIAMKTPTKPKPSTGKKFTEKQDASYDKKHNIKENSKKDLAHDKKMGVSQMGDPITRKMLGLPKKGFKKRGA